MGKTAKSTRKQADNKKTVTKSAAPAKGRAGATFPVVGIGASAGGLEALERFLAKVPQDSGMAFVIVQHLDPTHRDIMVELLQRATALPVVQITDRMKVVPNRVYVIPPNRDLSLLHGVLHLLEPAAPRGLRHPIDFFFRSLAEDRQQHGIAVILSGMGSDGALALRAIKEQTGAVFVQEPASAQFDGMPRSAIDSGLVDVVAPVEELPEKILRYFEHIPRLAVGAVADPENANKSGLEKVVLLLRTHTGHDFSHYKKSTMYRRIERRMGLHQLDRIADYVRYLRENPQEATLLFKELLIGVTNFFRDPAVWEQLKSEALPELLASRPGGGVLRAWIAGCSTGEEAYSLAIIFRETLEALKPSGQYSLQVFATDLDKEAIDTARTGVYPANIAADVSAERLRRFFVQEERGYRAKQEIRETVIFAPQNLVMDPPFTKLDLLCCRNLLIYLEPALQKKLLGLFHYSLNPDGVLVLGSAETTGQKSTLFTTLPGKTRLYRRQNTPQHVELVGFPAAFANNRIDLPAASPQPLPEALPAPNLQSLTDSLLLRHYTPAAVLTTANGDILYITGKTGKYLEPAVGKANLNLFAMAREGLGGVLFETFNRALRENTTLKVPGIKVGTNGGTQVVDVSVQSLTEPEALRGTLLVVFRDQPGAPARRGAQKGSQGSAEASQLADLNQQLQRSREELQTTREEMQSSQEELKSANEELQSTNEELQSTNEELTTSKEEMQSMNEELQTVNHELQAKVSELSLVGDDMKNLLNSIDIATLFLDAELRVRRFTPLITGIIKLIPGDIGRPITDIVSELEYPELSEDAREVLHSLVAHEAQVLSRDGRWFNVRILPYRTQDNRIDGVVFTFVDISHSKAQERALEEALEALKSRVAVQSAELDKAQRLEEASQKAQAVLERLLKNQGAELDKARGRLQNE